MIMQEIVTGVPGRDSIQMIGISISQTGIKTGGPHPICLQIVYSKII